MYNCLVSTLLLITVFPLIVGCGPIYYLNETKEHKAVRKAGYELCHLQSCGPESISDAYACFGIEKKQFHIGKEIQDINVIDYRGILSVVYHDFTKITCPPELLRYLKHKGFKINTVNSLDEVGVDDVAIILIRGKSDIRDWHYITYPTHSKQQIKDFFGEDTKIKKAYILKQ